MHVQRTDLSAAAIALAAHALLGLAILRSDVRTLWLREERAPLTLRIIEVTPVPAVRPPDVVAPRRAPDIAQRRAREAPMTSAPSPIDSPVAASVPPTVDDSAPVTGSESLMRLPKGDGRIGEILGTGKPLSPRLATLERALDARSDGPMSDTQRAGRNAARHLQVDLADDAVSAGLADDYFRRLANHVDTSWRPAMKQLNDGGASVGQIGMMKSFVDDRAAWDELWLAYLDLAKLYARGQRPKLETARAARLRELMRSRKGMFRFHAISELVLTQGPDGKVLTIEMPLVSGHPGIDEGAKDAISTAVDAMPEAPSARVHHGRSFTSTWRMRATWTMVPPTALLTGAGFDITPKGIHIDIPFDIKLKTAVLLLRTDAHAQPSSAPSSAGAEN